MSNDNKNDKSPVVDSVVVKTSDTRESQDILSATAKPSDDDQLDSFAELKKATDIVDADGNPVANQAQSEQAQKKAKIKADLLSEAKQESDMDELDVVESKTKKADAIKDKATSDKDTSTEKTTKASTVKKSAKDNAAKTDSKDSKDSKEDNSSATKETAKDNNDEKKSNTTTKDSAPLKAVKHTSNIKPATGQHRVAILGGNRIPFARSNGAYADASNIDMLTAALNGLIERYNLQNEKVGEVVAGAVMKLSRDINLTREAALNTALDPHTPTYDIAQACGTGLQATFASANKIALGIIDSAITGGVDTTSDAPIAIGDGLRKVIIKLGAAKNNKQRLQALMGLNPTDLIDTPKNGEPRTGLSMGDHQAITALEWNISREDQDKLAFNSHKNLARAYDEGFFDDLITPYKGLTRDNNLRPDSTLEKLGQLKAVFGKHNANPTMTAANSTPLTDGASCVLLGNDEWAEAHGLKALAYIVHQETAAVDFIGKSGDKEGLLMAPAYAVPRMLARAGLSLQDFDFYEIHEAFASQVLSTLTAWEDENFCQERLGLDAPLGTIDRSKLNVNGSSLAAGHPFAATGGRILATAAKLLDQKGSGRALISICAAGGQGVTCILEK